MKRRNWSIVLFLIALLAACGEADPTPIPEAPTAVNEPIAQLTAQPTAEPATAVAAATNAAPPPPPTLPPPPASPTPVPAEAPTATPTAEPVFLLSADDFGPNHNPLTGQYVENAADLERRPIACKLSNFPPQYTRPQSGVNSADILVEHVTEGYLTRFTAIFYGTAPSDIGPIRSARLIDLELPAMYDAALCFSGAGIGVSKKLYSSDIRPRILNSNAEGYFRTDENKPSEHTLHGDPNGFWEALDALDQNHAPNFSGERMTFTSDPPAGGQPATDIFIEYPAIDVEWKYDPENGRYWRWSDGEPHLDGATGEQMNFRNVVVPFITTVEDASICEQVDANGICQALSLEIQIWGSGPALVYRDGLVYDAFWHRVDRDDMLTFTDAAGNPLPLGVGNSMFQVAPTFIRNQVTSTP